jgi:hypothetical protein
MDNGVVREQLLALLEGGNAHMTFQNAIADVPPDRINSRVTWLPYSLWALVEHMRIAQRDILDFVKNDNYKELKWPDEYWPARGKEANERIWDDTVDGFLDDLEALKEIVRDPETDFTAPLPDAPKYNVFREILLVADHNSYHIGQIITLKRALKIY